MSTRLSADTLSEDDFGLPRGWATPTLSDAFVINPPKPRPDEVPANTEVSFVPMQAVDAKTRTIAAPLIRAFSEVRKGFTSFRDDDLIVAKITPCFENGKAAICRGLRNGLGFGSTEFHVLRTTGAIIPEYGYHFVNQDWFRRVGEDHMTGSVGQKRVPVDWLQNVGIPLPPLAEQKRIVAKVEQVLAQVNAARDRLAKVPTILKRFRQSVLAAAYSARFASADSQEVLHSESADELIRRVEQRRAQQVSRSGLRLGSRKKSPTTTSPPDQSELHLWDLPERWRWVTLRFLMDEARPFCYGVVQPGHSDPRGVPLIRAGDLKSGTVDSSQLRTISDSVDRSYPRSRVEGGEILITVVGAGIGSAGIVPKQCAGFNIARALAKVPIRDFSARYVFWFLNSLPAIEWMKGNSREVARPTLNLEQLQFLPVPLAPRQEQDQIASRIDALFALADSIELRAAIAATRVERLTQAVLAKAFRGELVPTEAELAVAEGRDYETAEELLERIRRECTELEPPPRSKRNKTRQSETTATSGKAASPPTDTATGERKPTKDNLTKTAHASSAGTAALDDDAMLFVRDAFGEGGARDRETAIRDVAWAMGFDRVGARVRDTASALLRSAVRRGILNSESGQYALAVRNASDYTRNHLIAALTSAVNGKWTDRDEAIRATARHLGHRRAGSAFQAAMRSALNGAIRRNQIESNGPDIRRAPKK